MTSDMGTSWTMNDKPFKEPKLLGNGLMDRLLKRLVLKKFRINHQHFFDYSKFRVITPLSERENIIGFVGRLAEGKGILNLLIAFAALSETRDDITLMVVGDGPLMGKVKKFLRKTNLGERVVAEGWVNNEDLPDCYNKMKMLVLPSYTEALPMVILEAMACSTPVLVTPVGAVSDYIVDGKTGFILIDNEPMTIIRKINRVLRCSDLEDIANWAKELVEKEFTFEAAVDSFRTALE